MKTFKILLFLLCAGGFAALSTVEPLYASPLAYTDYLPAETCRTCHSTIFEQYSGSYHAKAFSNPLFQAQYFEDVLPRTEKDTAFLDEAKACIACHSPIDSIKVKTLVTDREQIDPALWGVACDFCHTIKGYKGKAPGNGNFISNPSRERKLGPFREAGSWHHVYSELIKKSEFCGICHNTVNHHGLEVKSTFTEWKNSEYAAKGIQCQDCHMNLQGFLTKGKPVYEPGRAAEPLSTFGFAGPERALYTHRFPGAHSRTQIFDALGISLAIETTKPTVSAGDEIVIDVRVDNSRTGHKMPSGSKELRLLWLELAAYNWERKVAIPAAAAGVDPYDVAGKGPFDREILGEDISEGSRIYRAVFVDDAGKQTLSFYDAVKIVFDNRLNASEIRKERFHFKIPKDFRGRIFLQASLNYLPYPGSFSSRFRLPKPQPFEVSSARKELTVE
jgi:nitrate/TMAO reductase-like tetraheme cytochrome c subunit